MLTSGPAKKVTIFLNEDTQHHAASLHESIMIYLMHKQVAGATATRGFSGFGAHQLMHTPNVEALMEHMPIRIEFVETPEKVAEVLPTLYEMVSDGMIEVQDTTVIKRTTFIKREGKSAPAAEKLPLERKQASAVLLRVFIGAADKWHDEPLYDAIVKKLRMMEVSGATVYRGILGYGAKGHEHKRSFFHPMRDLPVMISVIDSAEKVAAAVAAIEEMMEDGLIVTSEVEMTRLVRGRAMEDSHASQ
jgi:PII-like signaling protein